MTMQTTRAAGDSTTRPATIRSRASSGSTMQDARVVRGIRRMSSGRDPDAGDGEGDAPAEEGEADAHRAEAERERREGQQDEEADVVEERGDGEDRERGTTESA